MDSTPDANMMEAEPSASAAAPPPQLFQASDTNQDNIVRGLLTVARQLNAGESVLRLSKRYVWLGKINYIAEFKSVGEGIARYTVNIYEGRSSPLNSNKLVIMATMSNGGDEAVLHVLTRAWEIYRNKLQASAVADEVASLFAECAIAEALPPKSGLPENDMRGQPIEPDTYGTSILAETGRKQIVLDAFSDGSSFICLQCSGLVSNHQKEEHYVFWCCKI